MRYNYVMNFLQNKPRTDEKEKELHLNTVRTFIRRLWRSWFFFLL